MSEGHSVRLSCQMLDEDARKNARGDSLKSVNASLSRCGVLSLETSTAPLLSSSCFPDEPLGDV